MDNNQSPDTDWLKEVLDEVGLEKFHSKLTNDLQLTKFSHFDFVSEDDLIQIGLSRPAAKRLLAAIKKRKSFVVAIKNKIVNKLLPNTSSVASPIIAPLSNTNLSSSTKNKRLSDPTPWNADKESQDFSTLTCLINSEDIKIKEDIGQGVHGFVKKGLWTTSSGRVVDVALKILRKDVLSGLEASFNDFVKEISVMHQLNHPNIIKLYGVVLPSMMMVTQLAPFGNLRDRLRKENGNTPISQLINFGEQIACGMTYLEMKRFIHRDLAARNIFISHGRKILIGDLGLMRVIPNEENHYVMSEKTKIPYPWCAPESLRYKQFSSASDVYMFGVTLWEMFSFGKEPWIGLGLNEILENISSQTKRLPCPKACPSLIYQTLLQCWNTEPSSRPSFSTLYQYLSTSYPLEVRSTQHISELNQKRISGNLMPNDLSIDSDAALNTEQVEQLIDDNSYRNILNCNVDDRILVVDGQPEKYWWKGQNQRTFEIGWFPLCSTRWMAPKKGTNFVSRPLKNSFIHTGHCGKDGMWGDPRFIDFTNLKNGNQQLKANSNLNSQAITLGIPNNMVSKPKTKSRLSKLFGINDSTNGNQSSSSSSSSSKHNLLPKTYHKFSNEAYQSTLGSNKKSKDLTSQFSFVVASSNNRLVNSKSSENIDDVPPLIDLSNEISTPLQDTQSLSIGQTTNTDSNNRPFMTQFEESLIDMDNNVSLVTSLTDCFTISNNPLQKHSSDTKLNHQSDKDCLDDYHLSWAGSWNTGTFDGDSTGNNIYSNYYCPQDAAVAPILGQTNKPNNIIDESSNSNNDRYYSAVSNDVS